MSAWAEAVWIVKKIQQNFDLEQEINIYTQKLNDLNTEINKTIDDVAILENDVNKLESKLVTIRAVSTTDITDEYSKGAICLIVDRL